MGQKIIGGFGGDFIQKISLSSLDLEKCNGEAISDELTNTCEICVALNKTVFKSNNSPTYTHPHCKCIQIPTTLSSPSLIFDMRKITDYLFIDKSKSRMIKSMGFYPEDAQFLYDYVSLNVTKEFVNGNYILKNLNKNGQHFQINYNINGKRDHSNETFQCYAGCIAYPNGKIKIATPLVKI